MDAHDGPPGGTPVLRVVPPSGGLRPLITLAAIAGALLVGALRPWDLVTTRSSEPGTDGPAGIEAAAATGRAGNPGAATDSASGSPAAGSSPGDARDPLWMTCGSPSGWRAATIQRWTGRASPIRSWIAIEPVAATGPLDSRIPFAPVATDVVTAIGYCSPLDQALRPPTTAAARLWAILSGIAVPLSPPALEPDVPDALGGLWRPAPEVAVESGGQEAWPAGRYVIEVRSPSASFDRWLGIEIQDLRERHDGTPAPASPGLVAPSDAPERSETP